MISYALTTMELSHTLVNSLGSPVTDAVVTVRIQRSGSDIAATGVTWPVTLTHSGAGVYQWVYPEGVRLALGTEGRFQLQITSASGGLTAYSEITLHVQKSHAGDF